MQRVQTRKRKDSYTESSRYTNAVCGAEDMYNKLSCNPKVSSGDRKYIPIGWLTPDVIAGDKLFTSENATLFQFGIVNYPSLKALGFLLRWRILAQFYLRSGISLHKTLRSPFQRDVAFISQTMMPAAIAAIIISLL